MEYKGKSYHEKCFCCSSCKKVIGKKSFVDNEEGYFCENCFEAKLANKCAKCKKVGKGFKTKTLRGGFNSQYSVADD